jgi:uncharacterized membrane protein
MITRITLAALAAILWLGVPITATAQDESEPAAGDTADMSVEVDGDSAPADSPDDPTTAESSVDMTGTPPVTPEQGRPRLKPGAFDTPVTKPTGL